MDQRITIGAGIASGRPIHRACVVPGCWCGSTAAATSSTVADRLRSAGRAITITPAANLTSIALRSVGLPVA